MIDEYVRKWLVLASRDLKVADHELRLPKRKRIAESICFHCQQAVEKFLKGFLIARGVELKKTHNIAFLLELCIKEDIDFQSIDIGNLTFDAVQNRYPDEFSLPSLDDVKECMVIAKKIKDFVFKKFNIEKFDNKTD